MGVMAGLPTVVRPQASGESSPDEASELLPLAGVELIPDRRAAGERVGPLQGRAGTDPGLCLHLVGLLVFDGAGGTTGPVPIVTRRRL